MEKEVEKRDTLHDAKPPVMPSTFTRQWKCAKTNPPTESNRYWCNVKEQNGLGVSYYQDNCPYTVGIGFLRQHANDIEITHWTELLPRPV
jgi:hypothetical protein